MKKAIICYKCYSLVKESECYNVKVTKYEEDDNNEIVAQFGKVKICNPCAKEAGYKVKSLIKKNAKQATRRSKKSRA